MKNSQPTSLTDLKEGDINKLASNYSSSKPNTIEKSSTIQIDKMNDELINSIRSSKENQIDRTTDRYPCCIVWTPLPIITWILPIIGHMGICYSNGIIRDFAGPYYVSENDMAFGRPTRYWRLDSEKIPGNSNNKRDVWDRAVTDASEIYKKRMHNLCCDNCHSHVACALNLMNYDNSSNWNMVKLCFLIFLKGKFVSLGGFLKTWLPFMIMCSIAVIIIIFVKLL